ncbi:MAG: ABC transporter permease subunit [Tannerella sp.]|jgi:ABC-type transport system involved in multi-copper enzyme maturation permease subunit|nr:ABC transporter permease subunit [Tannerella sp.]
MYHVFINELQKSIYNYRFLFCFLICLIFIPLSTHISVVEYKRELSDCEMNREQYNKQARPSGTFRAVGFRDPSAWSFLSGGIDRIIPQKAIVTKDGIEYRSKVADNRGSYIVSLLGRLDFHFVVLYIVSLLVIILSFDMVAGEKENGTLALVMANPLSRLKVLIAKGLSLFIMVAISILTASLLSLILIYQSQLIPLSAGFAVRFLLALLVSLLYVLVAGFISLAVSSMVRRSGIAVIVILLIWCFYTLIIPKTTPLAVKLIYPVKAEYQVKNEIKALKQDLNKELAAKENEITAGIFRQNQLSAEDIGRLEGDRELAAVKTELDESITPLRQEYEARIAVETQKIAADYSRRKQKQNRIAMNLSRLSPVACYSFIMGELAQNGLAEQDAFQAQSKEFEYEVHAKVYALYRFSSYALDGRSSSGHYSTFDPKDFEVPNLDSRPQSVMSVRDYIRTDFLLLCFYVFIWFFIYYYAFVKLDVRFQL